MKLCEILFGFLCLKHSIKQINLKHISAVAILASCQSYLDVFLFPLVTLSIISFSYTAAGFYSLAYSFVLHFANFVYKCKNFTLLGIIGYMRSSRCHHMSDFNAKMHQNRFRLGLCPRPHWGSLQRSPDSSWI